MNYKENKASGILKGKGFYLVLAGCLVATGVAAWSAYDGMQTIPEDNDSGSSYSVPEESVPEAPVGTDTESEPYSSEENSSDTAETPKVEITPPTVATSFILPINGNINKKFSEEELIYSETFGDMRLHLGTDVSAEPGQAVKSCGNGIVAAIIEDPMLGFYVEIDHGRGVVARYCGLNGEKLAVKEGDTVQAGSKLGVIGDIPAECVEAAHLHLEFYKDEYPVDPLKIINEE